MTDAERRLAEDIFRKLAADAELLVREALSANLKTTADLPHDLALALARDVDSVSLPMLKYSEVLTDDDLISIVRGKDAAAHQVPFPQPPTVSTAVAPALIDPATATAFPPLFSNQVP